MRIRHYAKDVAYREWAGKHLWVGDNPHKGLGIFARPEIKLEKLDWRPRGLKYFIPCRVNDEFNLLGTWCYGGNRIKNFKYIGQLWKYLQLHKKKLGTHPSPASAQTTGIKAKSRYVKTQTAVKAMIAGDFNSNVFWTSPAETGTTAMWFAYSVHSAWKAYITLFIEKNRPGNAAHVHLSKEHQQTLPH